MRVWEVDPSRELEAHFQMVADTRMAGLPILNPALQVQAIGFRRMAAGHWVGAMLTPWSLNLLCLPGQTEGWPTDSPGAKLDWHFASGDYEFTVTDDPQLGTFHLCSLFSPMSEFDSHEQARLTAEAAMATLDAPQALPHSKQAAEVPPSRRRFLGLGT